jgi:hypothetical protein
MQRPCTLHHALHPRPPSHAPGVKLRLAPAHQVQAALLRRARPVAAAAAALCIQQGEGQRRPLRQRVAPEHGRRLALHHRVHRQQRNAAHLALLCGWRAGQECGDTHTHMCMCMALVDAVGAHRPARARLCTAPPPSSRHAPPAYVAGVPQQLPVVVRQPEPVVLGLAVAAMLAQVAALWGAGAVRPLASARRTRWDRQTGVHAAPQRCAARDGAHACPLPHLAQRGDQLLSGPRVCGGEDGSDGVAVPQEARLPRRARTHTAHTHAGWSARGTPSVQVERCL